MNFPDTLPILLCAAVGVLIITHSFGRLAGISTAAACGAYIAFFALEPAFSFEIASPVDRGTMVVYGLTSVLLVLRKRKPDAIAPDEPVRTTRKPARVCGLALAGLLDTAAAIAWPEGIEIDVDPSMQVACTRNEIEPLLAAIMRAGVPDLIPTRISAYGGDAPGQRRIWLALQYKPWPSEPHALHIGRHADRCERLDIPGGTACSVTWFDNGFERVFQISIPVTQQ